MDGHASLILSAGVEITYRKTIVIYDEVKYWISTTFSPEGGLGMLYSNQNSTMTKEIPTEVHKKHFISRRTGFGWQSIQSINTVDFHSF